MRSEIFNRILTKAKQRNMKWYKRVGKPYQSQFDDAPIIEEIYPGNYTWGYKFYTVQKLFDDKNYNDRWEYIGEFDSKPEIIGYRFDNPDYRGILFTHGNIYQLAEGKKLNDSFAFIDDADETNGFGNDNHKYFKPVYGIKNNNDMKKELIGYKVKTQFAEYFKNIVNSSLPLNTFINDEVTFLLGDNWFNICKDSGILDIWCEPVYKTKELPIIDGHKPFIFSSGGSKYVRLGNIETSITKIKSIVRFMENYSVSSMTFFENLTVKLEEFEQILDYVS